MARRSLRHSLKLNVSWSLGPRLRGNDRREIARYLCCHGRACSGHPDTRSTVLTSSGSPGHRRAEATPFFERLRPLMTGYEFHCSLDIFQYRNIFSIVSLVRGASRGRFEAEQDTAPARVFRTHASGRLGPPSGPTTWLCRSRLHGMEMKAAKSAGSGFARPIRKYGPLAQNRRNGAP